MVGRFYMFIKMCLLVELLNNVYFVNDFIKVVVNIGYIGLYLMYNWCVVVLVNCYNY